MRPGYPDVIKLLLRDAEQRQGLGHARWVAAHHGNDEPIRLLLAKCANMNFCEANCLGQSTGRYPSPQEPSHLVVPNPQLVGDELLVMTCIDLDYSADATRIDEPIWTNIW
ncbi:ankyrin repeat protein [Aspergillus fumigatus]